MNCPTCNQSLATPALAFLHERGYCKLPFGLTGSIAELMEAYAEQARAAERERVAGVLSEYRDGWAGDAVVLGMIRLLAQRLGVELKGTP